ncbi:MAG: Rrf2 family transcriptional regulator [Oscillospiraceae bacterium]|nr:Rrf2 family transcriptional regulator [Oscillospiraceae bacterium]
MKISAKSRYALAALVRMGQARAEETITVVSLSETLGISKIYLEQVFALLKRGDIVVSSKGAQGGYRLARAAHQITAYDILAAIEVSLFEQAGPAAADKAPAIEHALQTQLFAPLDTTLHETLRGITLDALVARTEEYGSEGYMYYL